MRKKLENCSKKFSILYDLLRDNKFYKDYTRLDKVCKLDFIATHSIAELCVLYQLFYYIGYSYVRDIPSMV